MKFRNLNSYGDIVVKPVVEEKPKDIYLAIKYDDPDPPIDWDLSKTAPTAQPREDSIAGMTQEEFKMLLECKRIAEDILYILSNGNYKDPPIEPENLMQNVHSNLELTKIIIEELSTIKDLVCG